MRLLLNFLWLPRNLKLKARVTSRRLLIYKQTVDALDGSARVGKGYIALDNEEQVIYISRRAIEVSPYLPIKSENTVRV